MELRQNRPRQPVHPKREAMRAPKIKICGNRPGLQDAQKMFGRGFHNFAVADQVKCLVFDGALPAGLRRAKFLGNDLLHDLLPGAGCQRRVLIFIQNDAK